MNVLQETTIWAQAHDFMEKKSERGMFLGYERVICSQVEHRNLMFRLAAHNYGYFLVMGSCPGGYGGCEEHWHLASFGTIIDVEALDAIWNGILKQHGVAV